MNYTLGEIMVLEHMNPDSRIGYYIGQTELWLRNLNEQQKDIVKVQIETRADIEERDNAGWEAKFKRELLRDFPLA
jgi:hypothetical protein